MSMPPFHEVDRGRLDMTRVCLVSHIVHRSHTFTGGVSYTLKRLYWVSNFHGIEFGINN